MTSTIKERIYLITLLMATLFTWTNFLDTQAYNLNLESMQETLAAFVIFKGFDAAISLAESVPILGNIFSPFDDFIERMSFLMLLSLASLSLQKVLIIVVQSYILSGVVTILFALFVINYYKPFITTQWFRKLFKLFCILIFFRFVIPLMTFVVTAVEIQTIKQQDIASKQRAEQLSQKILDYQEMVTSNEKLEKQSIARIQALRNEIALLEEKIDKTENEISILRGSVIDKVSNLISKKENTNKIDIEKKQKEIEEYELQIDEKHRAINEFKGSFFDFANVKEKAKMAISNFTILIQDTADVLLNWAILFFFKNIFFPLLFLWGSFKLLNSLFDTKYELPLKVSSKINLE